MVQGKQILYGTNVEFRQSSKPTVRANGSALQTGDRWLSTGDRLWFYWNGTYWLSEQIFEAHTPFGSAVSATATWGHLRINQDFNLFLLDFGYGGQLGSPQDGSNYWQIRPERINAAASNTTLSTAITTSSPTISSNTGVSLVDSANLHLNVSTLGALHLRVVTTKVGSPGNLIQGVATTRYRLAKP